MALQVAQGGDKRMAQASTVSDRDLVPTPKDVTLPSSPAKDRVAPKMGADIESLIQNGNVIVNADGTVEFKAQAKISDSEIKYSVKKFEGAHSELKGLETDAPVGSLVDKNGYDLVADSSVKHPGYRNVFLTLGKDVERFTIEIDGKVYIIDKKQIEEFKEGKSKSQVVQYSEQGHDESGLPINRLPVAKYRDLENVTLSPTGEIQFAVTTTANNLLIHYERRDGSKSLSGYDTVFRHNDCYDTKLKGAYHQDRTFTLDVAHLDRNTVRANFTLDKEVTRASVTLDGKSYYIDTAELRNYINAERSKAAVVRTKENSSTTTPDSSTSTSSASTTSSTTTNPSTTASTPQTLAQVQPEGSKNEPTSSSGLAHQEGVERKSVLPTALGTVGAQRAVARNRADAERVAQGLPVTNNTVEARINNSRDTLSELRGNRPTTLEERKAALDKLNKNQRTAFNALDKETKALEAKTRSRIPFRSGMDVNNPEFKAIEEQLKANRTHKAELITEKAKLLAEIAADPADAKVQAKAQRDLVRMKPEVIKAYDKLIQFESDALHKQAIEVAKLEAVTKIEAINLTRGQKIANGLSTVGETLSRTPKLESARTLTESGKAGLKFIAETGPVTAVKTWAGSLPGVQGVVNWYNYDSVAKVNTLIANTPAQLTAEGFDGAKAIKLDNALSKEAAKLQLEKASGKAFTPEKEARLSSVNEARTKLAEKTKVVLEEVVNSPAGTHSDAVVNKAKQALYETYGERIEADLSTKASTPEGRKFLRERGDHLANKALSDAKLNKLPGIKEAYEAFNNAELAKQRASAGGATPADSLTAEVEFRKHALETAKARHLHAQEGISERLKVGLEVAKFKSAGLEQTSLTELETKLNTEIGTASAEQRPGLQERLAQVQNEKVRIEGLTQGAMTPQRIASNLSIKQAAAELKTAEANLNNVKNPVNELAFKEAKLKMAEARLSALVDVNIAGADANIRVLNDAISQLNTEIGTPGISEADKAVKEGQKRIHEKDIVKQQEIKADYEAKKPLLEATKSLADAEVRLQMQEKPNAGPVNQPEVDRLRAEVDSKKTEVVRLEAVNATGLKAKWAKADALINQKCKKFSNNPMKSLALYTTLTSGLKAAIHSDTDPEATHSWMPAFMADLKWERAEDIYAASIKTTAQLGPNGDRWARLYDGFSGGLDAGGRFAAIGGGFHMANSGAAWIYNKATAGQGGKFGRIVGGGVNAGFVGVMAYESGKSTYEGGQFIDYRGNHVTAVDNVDILIPGVMNTLMGSSVKYGRFGGVPGVIAAGAIQAVGSVHGINVALDKIDTDGNSSIAMKGVAESIDAAFQGFVMPIGADGRPLMVNRNNPLTKEQEQAFEDIARDKLYNHLKTASDPKAQGAVPASSKAFYAFNITLNGYSKDELSQLGLTFTNPNDPKEKAKNDEAFAELFSEDRTLWFGSTHFEGLPAELQKKITDDRLALKGYYKAIHESSLGRSFESVDQNSTKSLSWSEYPNQIAVTWFGWAGVRDTSGDWKNNEVGGTVKREDFLYNHCKDLSARADFGELMSSYESPTANNGFLLLKVLGSENHIPGTDQIVQTTEGLGRLVGAFHSREDGKPFKFGKMMTDFAKYSKDVINQPEFQQFVVEINSKGLFNESTGAIDERFEKYFPGITLYLNEGPVGMNAIKTILGDQHPLYNALNKTLSEHQLRLMADSSDVLSMPSVSVKPPVSFNDNYDILQKLVRENDFSKLGYFEAPELDTTLDSKGDFINPVGIRHGKGTFWAILHRVTDPETNATRPAILNVPFVSFESSTDEIVRLARDVYKFCSKDNKLIFNEEIKIDDLTERTHIMSGKILNDGSIFVNAMIYDHESKDSWPVSYLLSPYVEGGKVKWKKEEAHLNGDQVITDKAT
jgi:hypothetical protein